MNSRKLVRTTSVFGGGAAIMMMCVIKALIHLVGWAGDRHRARRRRAAQEK